MAPARALAALALLIAAVLATSSLFAPPAAHAQDPPDSVTLWTATMTAGVVSGGFGGDVSGFGKGVTGSLSDATFTHNGTDYEVASLNSFLGMTLRLDPFPTDSAIAAWVVTADGNTYALADATVTTDNTNGDFFSWTNPAASWTDGETDTVTIKAQNSPAAGVPVIQTGAELLSATMTVAGRGNIRGYASGLVGALSTTTFTLGGDTYTVSELLWDEAVGRFSARLDKEIPAAFVLMAGDAVFSSADANAVLDAGFYYYGWNVSGAIPWSPGDPVSVALNLPVQTPAVGTTLFVGLSGITDTNGLSSATYTYQWVHDDNGTETVILGATGDTLATVADDAGKSLRVKVSFSDDDGFSEGPLTSAPVLVNSPASGAPVIYDGAELLSATLTVASHSGNVGYIQTQGGSLSTTAFSSVGETFTVTGLFWNGATPGDLTLRTDKTIPHDFVLTAGSEDFPSADAFQAIAGLDETYLWRNTSNISWAVSDTVPITLSLAGQPPQVDRALDLDTSLIADANGFDASTFDYQWLRVDGEDETEIGGATSQTYTPAAADAGKALKVKVSFTDDDGFAEERASAASTIVNSPAAGAPVILAYSELLSSTMTVANVSGLLGYSDTLGGSLSQATFTSGGDTYTVKQLAWDTLSPGTLTLGLDKESPHAFVLTTGSATFSSADATASQTPTGIYNYVWSSTAISWAVNDTVSVALNLPVQTPAVGTTLFVDLSGITDTNGLSSATYTYQWVHDDNGTETVILGATGDTLATVADDAGKSLRVKVSFTDDDGFSEQVVSDATPLVNSPASGAPVILTGDEFFNSTLTVGSVDQFRGLFGSYGVLTPWTLTPGGETYTVTHLYWDGNVQGSLNLTLDKKIPHPFVLTAGDVVFSSADAFETPTMTSHNYTWATGGAISWAENDTVTITLDFAGQPPVAGVDLDISLSDIADANGFDASTFDYQWLRVDGEDETEIGGATSQTYTPVAADAGKALKVKVSFTDDDGFAEERASAASTVVNDPAAGPSAIQGGTELWTGTMETVSFFGSVGFSKNVAGSISTSTFTLGSDTYNVTQLAWDGTSLFLTCDNEFSHTFVMKTGDAVFFSADASVAQSLRLRTYSWDSSGAISWSGGDTVTAVLYALEPAPEVGGTAIADLSGISDANGVDASTLTYQWVRDDNGDETEIDGATSSTYMPVAEDGGKHLRVVVSFSDNDEFAEGPLTSAPALVNRPAEGAPLISTMGVGAQIFAESMTVGGTGRLGYSDGEYGVLITSFNADSVTYSLGELRWDGNDPGILTFGLDKELPGSFVLTAGTATFSSAAAFRNADDGNEIYRWNTSGDISWMNGDTVPVALNRTAPPVVGQTLPVDLSGISEKTRDAPTRRRATVTSHWPSRVVTRHGT